MAERVPSTEQFLAELKRVLDPLDLASTRAKLMVFARTVPVNQRAHFLDAFSSATEGLNHELSQQPTTLDRSEPDAHEPLLIKIEELRQHIESSAQPAESSLYENDFETDYLFPECPCMMQLADLLAETQTVFAGGRIGLACVAFAKLFQIHPLHEDEYFDDTLEPVSAYLEGTEEVLAAQYLRSIYETTTPENRATAIVEALPDLSRAGFSTNLARLREVLPFEPSGFEDFLPLLIAALQDAVDADIPVRLLLVEALKLVGGIDEIGNTARQGGSNRGWLYLSWIQELADAGHSDQAISAAHEALDAVGLGKSIRVRIAETLADLSVNKSEQQISARRIAWRTAPTQDRLLLLLLAAPNTQAEQSIMREECEALKNAARRFAVGTRLAICVMLLAGDVEGAIDVLGQDDPGSTGSEAADLLAAYLLISGSSAPSHQTWLRSELLNYLVDACATFESFPLNQQVEKPHHLIGQRFAGLVLQQDASAAVLDARMQVGLKLTGKNVDRIVSTKSRKLYPEAAYQVVMAAAAIELKQGRQAAEQYMQHWREKYPRHSAFLSELDSMKTRK
jgi:hypothetical protein